MILFGKTIVYFSQILNAFYALGQYGLGKNHSKYEIVRITNTKGEPILRGNDIQMQKYQVHRVSDYVEFRQKQMEKDGAERRLQFKTPLTLKYQGEFMKEFRIEPILESIRRRIYILNSFEGQPDDMEEWLPVVIPKQISSEKRIVEVPRYSNRQSSKIVLRGIEGELRVENVSGEVLELLLAGELIHIGKNTSFGFGRYHMN